MPIRISAALRRYDTRGRHGLEQAFIQESIVKRFISSSAIFLAGLTTLAASGVASAQSSTGPLTRAQVVAQLQRARASGELARETDELYGAQLPQAHASTVTRAEVKEELKQARDSGQLARETDELYGSLPPEPSHSSLTRAEVHAAAVQAARQHKLNSDENYPSDRPI
jgi:hypothetical protein